MATTPTAAQIAEMRRWVADCTWRDIPDDGDTSDLTDTEIVAGVSAHYEGGLAQFLADCE